MMNGFHICILGLMRYYDYAELATIGSLERHIKEDGSSYTFRDYGDKRKSTDLIRFEYCPGCGKKIDWKAIKNKKVEE